MIHNSIFSLAHYFPVRYYQHSEIFSQRIIKLKRANRSAIDYFANSFNSHFKPVHHEYIAVPVPSSEKNVTNGITYVCKKLAKLNSNIKYVHNAIFRNKSVESFCKSNHRSIDTIRSSISINYSAVNGKHILLIDDITTTGTTLLTIKQMLIAAGAASVSCCACAQTFYYSLTIPPKT